MELTVFSVLEWSDGLNYNTLLILPKSHADAPSALKIIYLNVESLCEQITVQQICI